MRRALALVFLCCLTWSAASAASTTHVTNRRLAKNQILAQGLRAADLTTAEAESIITALSGVFDFRHSRDGDQLRIVRVDGVLTYFDYRQSAVDEWQVHREGERLIALKRPVEVEKKVELVELTVDSSLYEAATKAHEDPVIAMALADVFAWDIDFYSDVQKGDHARAVVEKYSTHGRFLRYGEVLAANYQGSSVGQKRVYRYVLPNGDVSYFQKDGQSARKSFLKSPLKYAHVTSSFGSRFHPVLQYVKNHNGVDYGTPVGTPVWAVADGAVTKVAQDGGAGKHVCLRHANGFETCYLHLSAYGAGMHVGAHVSQKQVIAYSGNTGMSTGPHLHFAMKRGGAFINPLNQKFPRADPLPPELIPDFKEKTGPLTAELEAGAILPSGTSEVTVTNAPSSGSSTVRSGGPGGDAPGSGPGAGAPEPMRARDANGMSSQSTALGADSMRADGGNSMSSQGTARGAVSAAGATGASGGNGMSSPKGEGLPAPALAVPDATPAVRSAPGSPPARAP